MSDAEFDDEASALADRITTLWTSADIDDRIAAACRGSANPAALAWLAESLRITPASRVGDFGAGLGGPAAWLAHRWGCCVIAVDPARGSVDGARRLFDLPALQGEAHRLPFPDGTFDVGLLLGVVSVVGDAVAALRESRRVADRLGLLDYCSTSSAAVTAGGSTFRTPAGLAEAIDAGGWDIDECAPIDVPAPTPWARAADEAKAGVPVPPSEREVAAAIESGRLGPYMVAARRRP